MTSCGATVHLWLTEEAAPAVRATDDVDVICDVTTYSGYQVLATQLRERGLEEAADERVICRWRHAETGLAIDVMPQAEDVLGFSNRWYELGIETAIERTLSSGKRIRAIAPPVLVATKLVAWRGRGQDDVMRSLDVHDIVVLVDGRAELTDELDAQRQHLRAYVATELNELATTRISSASSNPQPPATARSPSQAQRLYASGSTQSSAGSREKPISRFSPSSNLVRRSASLSRSETV